MAGVRLGAGMLAAALLWAPSHSHAQPAPAPAPPAPSQEAPSEGAPANAPADEEVYGRHMDNGVKLYSEGNYDAAIAEFEAAYKVKPNASPLINLALCYKKQAEYAKAIAVLEQATDKHDDTMKPEHRAAAEREIKEMRALLAYVRVEVTPAEAQLSVDGRPVSADERANLALSPGQHQLKAQADGYKTVEQTIKLVSGDKNEPVKLKRIFALIDAGRDVEGQNQGQFAARLRLAWRRRAPGGERRQEQDCVGKPHWPTPEPGAPLSATRGASSRNSLRLIACA